MDAPSNAPASGAPQSSPNRRNSAGLFPSLMNQKQSEGAAARRQSLHDQRPATGIFGQMWHNFVRAPSNGNK